MAIKVIIIKNYTNSKYETIYKTESYILVIHNFTALQKLMHILALYAMQYTEKQYIICLRKKINQEHRKRN